MQIGEAIQSLRASKGLSQGDLAKQAGVAPSYVSRIEAGKQLPSLSVFTRIARGLGTTLSHLLILGEDQTVPVLSESRKLLLKSLSREIELAEKLKEE